MRRSRSAPRTGVVLRRITLPLMLPGVVSAAGLLAFINSFDEVTMTVFIAAPGTETLPVRMFLYIQDNIDPLVDVGLGLRHRHDRRWRSWCWTGLRAGPPASSVRKGLTAMAA